MRAVALLTVALVAIMAVHSLSFAGANQNGRVWLSWDRAGLVTDLSEVTFNERDVFLHLDGAPDIQALAIHLTPPRDATRRVGDRTFS